MRKGSSCFKCAKKLAGRHENSGVVNDVRSIIQNKLNNLGEREVTNEDHQEFMKKINEETPVRSYNNDQRYNYRCVLIRNVESGRKKAVNTKEFQLLQEKMFSLCRQGEYTVPEIQEDFNDHGPDSFEFIILSQDRKEKVVQKTVDALNRLFEIEELLYGDGFISEGGVVYYLKDPDGIYHEVQSVKEFSLRNGLVLAKLYKLINGELDSYNGWENATKKEYENGD